MNILIAVKSYQEMWKRGAHEKIRRTWGSLCGNAMDVRFFFGGQMPQTTAPDEVWLSVEDHYQALSKKVNEIFRWAVERHYDYVVLVDTDTFIHVPNLSRLPWGHFDYAGQLLTFGGGFMFGGCGLAVSFDAMNIVLNNEIAHVMDDISIGKILLRRPQHDIRVLPHAWDRCIGWHFPKKTYSSSDYDPQFPWMELMAQAHFGFPKMQYKNVVYIGGAPREVVIELSRVDREAV